MTSIIALDLETTGLDAKSDDIIEVGVVRFNNHRIEGKFTTLVNPGRRIPPYVTQLTGINDQMVLRAPTIHEVLPDLLQFVGDSPILGHSIGFDLAFLRRYKLFQHNRKLDTYELASVLMPNAGRYNLGALAQALGVLLPATHRALDDAEATRGVYIRLMKDAMELPLPLLAEIVRLSEHLDWGAHWAFRNILTARRKELISQEQIRHAYEGPIFEEKAPQYVEPLQLPESPEPLDTEETASILGHGGLFSKHFPHYEYRPQQVEMLKAVANAVSHGQHLMVEAGTGTGKSMAYLVPAALWAIKNNTRVVISTNTINLQDQLIHKDIPDLRQILGLDLRATVLKGRSNYLCPRRLEIMRRRGPETVEEMRVLGKILVWLRGTHSGDKAELNLNGPVERQVWTRLSAEDDACTTENCVRRTGGICPFYRARQAAQSAHLLIVNHALLLADVATGNRVLPDYDTLIIDEAHHMESATTQALSYRVTQSDIERLLHELGGPKSGTLGWLLGAIENILSPGDYAAFNRVVQEATDISVRFESLIRTFFRSIEIFLEDQRQGQPAGNYSQQERILPATRTQPAWMDVEISWDEAQHALSIIIEQIATLAKGLAEIVDTLAEEDDELFSSMSNIHRRFNELNENVNALVFKPDPQRIYWAEKRPNSSRLALHAAPLHIGPLMQRHLWHEKTSVILTSATLTAAGEFDYIRERLYAEDADELALGSPFDYENAVLLYLVNDIAEPSDRQGHQRALVTGLIHLCRATGGRTLALFTSYDQLRRTSRAISKTLAKDGIVVYEQGEGASPHNLLENFRSSERAVLLGTRAFWEGVDIPGEDLSVLVLAKIPFDVPSDPVIAARSETFDDPFYQYAVPEAILRFRQGFGRLIRSQYDRGVVAIFDKRLLSKRYGRAFIDSLPHCTTRTGPLAELARTAAQWLNI